jgi:sulfur carrier protein|tara:strand:- start:10 stop:225 length:216 start_codon:yes stop_codon:yes gene_type:complete
MDQQNNILNINGLNYFFTLNMTIFELMEYLGFNKNVIVIDYNGIILDKNLWAKTYLKNKDCLEILSIAGGG